MKSIIEINKSPYKYLYKTSYFKDEIKDFHYVANLLVEENKKLIDIGAISKGIINNNSCIKIDSFNSLVQTFNYEFSDGKDFLKNFNELIINIKINYPNSPIIFDIIDNDKTKANFLKFLNDNNEIKTFITYDDYLKIKETNQTTKNENLKPGIRQPALSKNKIIKPTNYTLDLFSQSNVEIEKQEITPKKLGTEKNLINEIPIKDIPFVLKQEHSNFNIKRKYDDNINALETLINLLKTGRKAYNDEKNILSKYVGFGGLKEISFDPDNALQWNNSTAQTKEYVRKIINQTKILDTILETNNTLSRIRSGILNAHYTSSEIIQAMYAGISHIGFKGGSILEPSAGIGNFIGYMPNDIYVNSTIEAIEIDPITSKISSFIYDQNEHQNKPYEEALILDESKDLVISNVPFGDISVYDDKFKNRAFLTKRIHNYFFAKALDHTKEGGLIVFVTSKGLLDSKGNEEVRRYLNSEALFLGAVRLNNESFKNSSGTQVVADIIFLKKDNSDKKSNPNFIDLEEILVDDKDGQKQKVTLNRYFYDNPQNIMGTIVSGSGLYNNTDYTVENNSKNSLESIILKTLEPHKNSYVKIKTTEKFIDKELIEITKEGNIILKNNKAFRREGYLFEEVTFPKYVQLSSIENYLILRNKTIELIQAEYNNSNDDKLEALRKELNDIYETSGLAANASKDLNKQWMQIASQDGDGFTIMALTNENGNKADILNKRTITPNVIKGKADTIDDAIIISLNKHAKLEIDTLKSLLGKTEEEILEISVGKIYKDPHGHFFSKAEYLSGDVKTKLKDAQDAFEKGNISMQNNIDELLIIQPKDIPIHEIEVRMGSRWIPSKYYEDFGKHLFNDKDFRLIYYKTIDSYATNGNSYTIEAQKKYGTPKRNASDLFIDALHIKPPVIRYTEENGKVLIDKEATQEAVEKYEQIREYFVTWIYKDQQRRDNLEKKYNELLNRIVKPSYDGSFLQLPGLKNITPRPHQKDAIWRGLTQNGGIIDHKVGAGKTLVMICTAMELKRTKICNKPLISGLKSTIPEIYRTFKETYPLAKILCPADKDFEKKNRHKLLSKIALNDWDCIILSHEQVGSISHSPDFETKMIYDEIAEIEYERGSIEDKKQASILEKRVKKIEEKIKDLLDSKKDNTVYFQQMGIDHIFIDESQQFKNLAYVTKQSNVAGLSNPKGSKRAFNLLMALRTIQNKYGSDKGVTFLSGTILSNSIVEMYSVLKYLRPNTLYNLGLDTFDQWASTFTSPTTEIEFTVTGEFKSKTRFREFMNLPELSIIYNEIADVRNDDNLKLDKPIMKTGSYQAEILEMSSYQKDYGNKLIQFAKTQDGSHINKNFSSNQLLAYMLIVTNLAAKMSIDMRLIQKGYPYDPNGKIGKLTDNVIKIYNNTNLHKGAQLIFSDIGTPKNRSSFGAVMLDYMQDSLNIDQDNLDHIFGKFLDDNFRHKNKQTIIDNIIQILEINEDEINEIIDEAFSSIDDFNLYDETKLRLVEKGINENEIVFIHDYKTKKQKLDLFKKVNNGEIRVLLGSTQKLGTGVNAQERIAAIHHLDAPWRPSDMEQRNGRGLRQGNWLAKHHLNNEIDIFVYATQNTLDLYKYQLLQTKMTFISQVSSGTIDQRIIKESSLDGAESFAIIMAQLSGNDTILEKFKLLGQQERLIRAEKIFNGMLFDAESKIKQLESSIESIRDNANKTKMDIEYFLANTHFIEEERKIEKEIQVIDRLHIKTINGEPIKMVDGKQPTMKECCQIIVEIIENKLDKNQNDEIRILDINNFTLIGKRFTENRINPDGNFYQVESTSVSVLGNSGNKYQLSYSKMAGLFLNNLTSRFQDFNYISSKQDELLEQKIRDLAAYKNILLEKDFPKKQELERIKKKIKKIDEDLKKSEEVLSSKNDEDYANKIVIDNISYPIHDDKIQNNFYDNTDNINMVQETNLYIYNNDSDNKFLATDKQHYDNNVVDDMAVKAIITESNHIDFYSNKMVIDGPEDVYHIMKALENKAVEHIYAVHICKDNKPTLQFLGMGGISETTLELNKVTSAALEFKSKMVYLVHNHPSGSLNPSAADKELTLIIHKQLQDYNIDLEHIIINTYNKAYTQLIVDWKNEIDTVHNYVGSTHEKNEDYNKLRTFSLNEFEFLSRPLAKIKERKDVFKFIQNKRFSAQGKTGIIVLSSALEIIGNFHVDKPTLKEIFEKVRITGIGKSVILYSNNEEDINSIKLGNIKDKLHHFGVNLIDLVVCPSSENIDVIDFYKSFANEGLLEETSQKYKTNNSVFEGKMTIESKIKWNKREAYCKLKETKDKTIIKQNNNTEDKTRRRQL